MPGSVDTYRAQLKKLKDWEPYLKKHSGLPGPRANLELVAAVAEEADPDRLWRFSASSDEFSPCAAQQGWAGSRCWSRKRSWPGCMSWPRIHAGACARG